MAELSLSKLFGLALREVRMNRGMSQEELAHKSELDRTYISMLERGIKNPTIQTVFQISKALDISADFLISQIQKPISKLTFKKVETKQTNIEMPLFGTAVSCGKPVGNDYHVEKVLSLESLAIKSPKETFFVRALGESMMPTIRDGDYLIVDKGLQPKNGQIILAQIEEDRKSVV